MIHSDYSYKSIWNTMQLSIISLQFMAYLTSHLYFMAFLTLLCVAPPDNTVRQSMVPFWYEITVWVWYLGLLLSQLTNPGAKGGLSWAKYLLVILGLIRQIHIIWWNYYWTSFHITISHVLLISGTSLWKLFVSYSFTKSFNEIIKMANL